VMRRPLSEDVPPEFQDEKGENLVRTASSRRLKGPPRARVRRVLAA
jgi:hypothetical protein